MAELLKRTFELFVKKRWLKTIYKEYDKYKKIEKQIIPSAICCQLFT